jgi:uncharacterized protein with HEPN domain
MHKVISLLLDEIFDSITIIEETLQGIGYDDYRTDRKKMITVVNNLENIIYLISKIPLEFKEVNPGVPWDEVDAFNSKILHGPSGIDEKEVWDIAKIKLFRLNKVLLTLK